MATPETPQLHIKCDMPNWVSHWRVDEVIECLDFGDKRTEITRELLGLMPNAYSSHPDDPDGEAGKNEWPEADSHADRKLSTIWNKLKPTTQKLIHESWISDHPQGESNENT